MLNRFVTRAPAREVDPQDITVEVRLPAEMIRSVHGKTAASQRLREDFVLGFLRRHEISQGRAAELLGLDRYALILRMNEAEIPAFDYDADELASGLEVARRISSQAKT